MRRAPLSLSCLLLLGVPGALGQAGAVDQARVPGSRSRPGSAGRAPVLTSDDIDDARGNAAEHQRVDPGLPHSYLRMRSSSRSPVVRTSYAV